MTLTLIAAMAENRVIGVNGQLPWHLQEDLKRFRQATLGRPMIMGRITFESIGRPLPGRETIVLSRGAFNTPGCHHASTWKSALDAAQRLAITMGADEIAVVGGEQIYRLAMPEADRILLTVVHREVTGDAIFPHIPEARFSLASTELSRSSGESISYLDYRRIL